MYMCILIFDIISQGITNSSKTVISLFSSAMFFFDYYIFVNLDIYISPFYLATATYLYLMEAKLFFSLLVAPYFLLLARYVLLVNFCSLLVTFWSIVCYESII